MRQRFYEVAHELLATDPRSALVMADIGTGAVAPHPRLINVGIREQLMIGVAAGLALEGYRPIVHSYAPFLVQRPWEQIKLDLGHQGAGAVLVSVGASYDAAGAGRTHQAPEDVALLATLPDWTIHVPGHGAEMEAQLRSAMTNDEKVYIRLDARSNRSSHHPSGVVTPIREGSPHSPLVIAVGPMLDLVMDAMSGLDVTVGYASTIRPFDQSGVRRLAGDRSDVAIVEPYLEGTSHGVIAAALNDLPRRIASIGYKPVESRRYGTPDDHLIGHGLDAASLRGRLTGFFEGSRLEPVLI